MGKASFWRRLTGFAQPPGVVAIDLHVDDATDLGATILNLQPTLCEQLGCSNDRRCRLIKAVSAYDIQRHQAGMPLATGMVPVRLSEADWLLVFNICQLVRRGSPHQWAVRVTDRIAAQAADLYPEAGGSPR